MNCTGTVGFRKGAGFEWSPDEWVGYRKTESRGKSISVVCTDVCVSNWGEVHSSINKSLEM